MNDKATSASIGCADLSSVAPKLVSRRYTLVSLVCIAASVSTAAGGTTTGGIVGSADSYRREDVGTGALIDSAEPERSISASKQVASLADLRRLSGLTWDQLAGLFSVSRRSVHFWSSGKAMSADNELHLQRSLAVLQLIDIGDAAANRHLLHQQMASGLSRFELLVQKRYQEAASAAAVESSAPRRRTSTVTVSADRMPTSPEDMISAVSADIPLKSGAIRKARVRRAPRAG